MMFSKYFQSMYHVTVALLLLLAAVASYARGFPVNLLTAVLVAAVLDVAIKKVILKKKVSTPLSAIISGLIIGSIAPFDAPVIVVIVASAIAIFSKYVIRIGSSHIFNPATLGLLVSLAIFRLGDAWWATEASVNIAGTSVVLMPLLLAANYKAMKLSTAIPFLAATAVFFHLTGITVLNSAGILSFLESLPYYFAFIMVSEPRTSPYVRKEQAVFGISVAILSVVLTLYSVKYSLFVALLLGNIAYALYRSKVRKEALMI